MSTKGIKRGPRPPGWINPRKGVPNTAACRPIEERFWEKVNKDGPVHPTMGPCWAWIGAHRRDRPVIWSGGQPRVIYAHRLVFELTGRGKVPGDMFVDHLCRNGMCVNPDHLRIVTPSVNSTENNVSPFALNRAKTECIKGHPFTPDNIIWMKGPKDRRPTRVCIICRPHMVNSRYRVSGPDSSLSENTL